MTGMYFIPRPYIAKSRASVLVHARYHRPLIEAGIFHANSLVKSTVMPSKRLSGRLSATTLLTKPAFPCGTLNRILRIRFFVLFSRNGVFLAADTPSVSVFRKSFPRFSCSLPRKGKLLHVHENISRRNVSYAVYTRRLGSRASGE